MKILELKWSDETNWKTVRVLRDSDNGEQIIAEATAHDAIAQHIYGHTFHAEFRVREVKRLASWDYDD